MGQQALTKSCAESGSPVETGAPAPSLAAFKIKQFRRDNGLTRTALAEQLGVSQPAVLYWEKGEKTPRHEMQGKLHERGICAPNDWHEPAPVDVANDDGQQSAI